jgi:hypothetical protein
MRLPHLLFVAAILASPGANVRSLIIELKDHVRGR